MGKRKIAVIDDDLVTLQRISKTLEKAGYTVVQVQDSTQAIATLTKEKPSCAILDIMMPKLDGIEVMRRIKEQPDLSNTKIIAHSAKGFVFDKRRAQDMGCDIYLVKPANESDLTAAIEGLFETVEAVEFWGVRGTLPVSGESTLKYGGNTSCVSLKLNNGTRYIFDAGTGIKPVSDLVLSSKDGCKDHKIFISHAHWDHINCLPFFGPLYIPGHSVDIYGPGCQDLSVKDMLSDQMSGIYFPITLQDLSATLNFHNLAEDEYKVDGHHFKTMLLSHPGNCLGYRFEIGSFSFCYVTDNELFREDHPSYSASYFDQLADFVRGANILITDSTYTPDEYETKVSWGHSSVDRVADLAAAAEVETLCLFHHDPGQHDRDIDAKLSFTRERLSALGSKTRVLAPSQSTRLLLIGNDLVDEKRHAKDSKVA